MQVTNDGTFVMHTGRFEAKEPTKHRESNPQKDCTERLISATLRVSQSKSGGSVRRLILIPRILIWGILFVSLQTASAGSLSDRVSEILQSRLTTSEGPRRILCRKEFLCGPNVLLRFYGDRAFRPAWSADDRPLAAAETLIEAIHAAKREGLRPDDYHLNNIQELLARIYDHARTSRPPAPEILADLDLLLTDAFLLYGSHLLTGHVNPETIQSEWLIKSREADLARILQAALDANQIETALENLGPQHAGYGALKKALLRYEKIMTMGGWRPVPDGPTIEQGDRGLRVRALRTRLIVSGDLEASGESDHDLFDEALERAVESFQRRHGLKADGVVGRATLKSLNVPVSHRVYQIKLNLERWRWLPHDLGWRHILVNIADFELYIAENDQIVLTMRVVVGRKYRRTPVFSGKMRYMELNPYWHIPTKIAIKDILPKIQRDPNYLVRQNIRVFQSWENNAPEIHPESIDWSRITAKNFSFKLRQEPGPKNALGRVIFKFPNKFSVYLHDTPARALFQRTRRSFSAGCIRIEKPIDLAIYLLRGDPLWTKETIIAAINSAETQIFRIPEPIAVHLLYWTAWVDSDGMVHFRDDIYGRDKRLDKALNERPPEP